MKKFSFFLSIFGIIGFIVLNTGNKTSDADVLQELETLATVFQDESIMITEWSLYAKESLVDISEDKDEESFATDLKAAFPDWQWDEIDNQIIARSTSPGLVEQIKIVSTDRKRGGHTYIMYEVRGQSWEKNTSSFLSETVSSRMFDIFRGNITTFSCLQGEISDKINAALPAYKNKLLKAFHAKEIEGMEEASFISISADSPLFNKSLGNDHKMNMQLGLRKTERLGGKTTVVVGTPIITIEY